MNQGPRPSFIYFSVHFLVICHVEINEKEHVKQKDTFHMTNPSNEDHKRPPAISDFRNGISVNHHATGGYSPML